MQQRKNHQDSSLESLDIPYYVIAINDGFLQISRNQGRSKKSGRVKVVPFGVLYSCVKFRRLKMGDPVYLVTIRIPKYLQYFVISASFRRIFLKIVS